MLLTAAVEPRKIYYRGVEDKWTTITTYFTTRQINDVLNIIILL